MFVRDGRFFPPEIGHLIECKLLNRSNKFGSAWLIGLFGFVCLGIFGWLGGVFVCFFFFLCFLFVCPFVFCFKGTLEVAYVFLELLLFYMLVQRRQNLYMNK